MTATDAAGPRDQGHRPTPDPTHPSRLSAGPTPRQEAQADGLGPAGPREIEVEADGSGLAGPRKIEAKSGGPGPVGPGEIEAKSGGPGPVGPGEIEAKSGGPGPAGPGEIEVEADGPGPAGPRKIEAKSGSSGLAGLPGIEVEAGAYDPAGPRKIKVVAFGGGHGLAVCLRALRSTEPALDLDITAVVTVGDNGGSSGRLRVERHAQLPPGDLRMALAALADDEPLHQRTVALMQHRFALVDKPGPRWPGPARRAEDAARADPRPGRALAATGGGTADPLAGHAVGNLLLLGLMELLGDPVEALEHAGRMVGARGRVLPMACHAVGIEADVRGVDPDRPDTLVTVEGQHAVAITTGHVEAVRITPASPPASPPALAAIAEADWLIFGPGSWYTSVLPHLLVPELAAAIVASPARRLVTLNLAADNETAGLSVADHLAALHWYLPQLHVDTVLADAKWVGEPEPVDRAARELGARLVLAPLAVADGHARHDPESLGVALVPVLGAAR